MQEGKGREEGEVSEEVSDAMKAAVRALSRGTVCAKAEVGHPKEAQSGCHAVGGEVRDPGREPG